MLVRRHLLEQTGKDYTAVDTSKLPPGSVVVDDDPPGHVSVTATGKEIVDAAVPPPATPKGQPVGADVGRSGRFPRDPKKEEGP
jgi:hypothetical protein